jgi:2-amino-4-hydroxy-6-hydroxymethyldihydropteridine diphosphokinase
LKLSEDPKISKPVYLGLGSNLGDRHGYLLKSIRKLAALPSVVLNSCSSVYETPPVGNTEQPYFLNTVIEVTASLTPEELLNECQEIERLFGRYRFEKWGPRTIDIDILFWEDYCLNSENMQIPHPHACTRAFVMIPLCEIAPDFLIPGKNISVRAVTRNFLNCNFNIVDSSESLLRAVRTC